MDTMSDHVATVRCTTTVAVADARDTMREFLAALGPASVDPEAADTAVLVVSELVTNALRHGGGICTLRLTAHPGAIEVAVDDADPRPPRPRTPDLTGGTGGFGWHMVNDLALVTAVIRRPGGGKTVSALLAR
ncbi:ATP-binding protein [Streptomyces sp. CB00455]|uniref:ATP-binding protein n=1 Tax=Streptomyces sp. CB00455 TaxID=1703927 RepID=UPI000938FD56|nr:ATP-binding protein [Streptomyces sp. CB00455]OKK17205.1 ATP-binding protein [Streptomyces sp. CB00455]